MEKFVDIPLTDLTENPTHWSIQSNKQTNFTSTALQKTINEVKYWLDNNDRELSDDEIETVSRQILGLFTGTDYSSLEAATEDVMSDYDFYEDYDDDDEDDEE